MHPPSTTALASASPAGTADQRSSYANGSTSGWTNSARTTMRSSTCRSPARKRSRTRSNIHTSHASVIDVDGSISEARSLSPSTTTDHGVSTPARGRRLRLPAHAPADGHGRGSHTARRNRDHDATTAREAALSTDTGRSCPGTGSRGGSSAGRPKSSPLPLEGLTGWRGGDPTVTFRSVVMGTD